MYRVHVAGQEHNKCRGFQHHPAGLQLVSQLEIAFEPDVQFRLAEFFHGQVTLFFCRTSTAVILIVAYGRDLLCVPALRDLPLLRYLVIGE